MLNDRRVNLRSGSIATRNIFEKVQRIILKLISIN